MCIFSRPVVSVNDTKIFARKTNESSQFLVYQMNYSSVEANAMILPIPTAERVTEDVGFQFIDLSGYAGFFDDFESGFPYVRPMVNLCCGVPPTSNKSALKVHEVGSYVASFVPDLASFDRLDPQFALPESTWAKVPKYSDYSFVVFQLAKGEAQPHPMAFEFLSKIDEVFFPTMHIHDGEVHPQEEFDHQLYLQHAAFDSQAGRYVNHVYRDTMTGWVRSKHNADQFFSVDDSQGVVLPDLLVHRKMLYGMLENRDVVVDVKGDAVEKTINFRRLNAYTPWAVVAGAATWFFARRNRVRRQENSGEGRL